jgi:hypothetical protein
MRKLTKGLLALTLPVLAFAAAPAAAQGVYVDTGPAAFGFGVGPAYDPYGPVKYDYYYGPEYDYSTRTRVYSYTRRVYRPRVDDDVRVYGWRSAPPVSTETTVITTARPGNCGTYHYWHEGRCVDARE